MTVITIASTVLEEPSEFWRTLYLRREVLIGSAIALETSMYLIYLIGLIAYNQSQQMQINSLIVVVIILLISFLFKILIFDSLYHYFLTINPLIEKFFTRVSCFGVPMLSLPILQIDYYSLLIATLIGGMSFGCLLRLWYEHHIISKVASNWWIFYVATAIAISVGTYYYMEKSAFSTHTGQQLAFVVNNFTHFSLPEATIITTIVILFLEFQEVFTAQRLRTEVALAESQRRLTTLIDSLPGIAFVCSNDPGWTMTYVSEGCLELTGYRSDELTGTTGLYNAITHPEDLSRVLQSITKAVEVKRPYVIEYRIFTKSGELKWLWEKGNGVFNSNGEILGLEGFITDISELKRSEVALKESEQRYRELFESHPCPMWVYDLETLSFLAVNNAAIQHYGYKRDEFLSMTIKDLRPPEDIARLMQ
ncbi:PAS domain S-box protein [Gloeocapsopsis crepidinum LEGE 06123]|uniref:histidine kinase n=1 Tax=Gloeocapsopsis crepidinum LEGE 06123 TaxID=588587 RepID=A0ABR9UXP3_9CHRO|nr:PAS domain S-box protein [Gloeocapsopsis crepidinum]MBE9192068.1 PAS domain S-box protein [Gloeocapsopsis crepidinum LEGE 06123]